MAIIGVVLALSRAFVIEVGTAFDPEAALMGARWRQLLGCIVGAQQRRTQPPCTWLAPTACVSVHVCMGSSDHPLPLPLLLQRWSRTLTTCRGTGEGGEKGVLARQPACRDEWAAAVL